MHYMHATRVLYPRANYLYAHDFYDIMQHYTGVSCIGIDPTHFVRHLCGIQYDRVPYPDRKKQWVMATLADHSKWLNKFALKWPIEMYGRKYYNYVPEAELLKIYANSTGIIANPYYHAGSGWWRMRYWMGMKTGTYVQGFSRDNERDGFLRSPEYAENCSIDEVAWLAEYQAERMLHASDENQEYKRLLEFE
jgi:hypothetical protein